MRARRVDISTRSAVGYVSLVALLGAVGCSPAVFPKELFTVEAASADYPVMLSKAPAKDAGRSIQAQSGTHFAQSSSTSRYGRTQVTITRTESGQSEMAASEKLAAKVRRTDRWLQMDSALFVAEDFAGYSFTSADRSLSLEGKAHQ